MTNLTNKQLVIIVSIVIVIIALILFFTYRAGKKSGDTSNVNPPNDVIGTPLTEDEKNYLNGLAVSLYNDMDGINMTWNNDLYSAVALLSDSHLVALSNIFNYKYQSNSGETFLQWLENENFSWDSYSLATNITTVKNRLRNLGVS